MPYFDFSINMSHEKLEAMVAGINIADEISEGWEPKKWLEHAKKQVIEAGGKILIEMEWWGFIYEAESKIIKQDDEIFGGKVIVRKLG